MKHLFLISFIFGSSTAAFASLCKKSDVLFEAKTTYQCEHAETGKTVCVNFGDFRFAKEEGLRIFEPDSDDYDHAIIFNETSRVKCIFGISACEWVSDTEATLEARRRIIPDALLKSSDTKFSLYKKEGTATLSKTTFDKNGDEKSLEVRDYLNCK